ncbi:MAG: SBBP repeat-containing protein, partial [Acidimicrobiales bacterium]|nr:SBBP repeat-containing protein [Acidimicrobiales bacterium]
MLRTLLRLTAVCVLVVVGWGSSAGAWDTTAGSDTNYGSITFGGTDNEIGFGVAVDGSGNVYTTGYFSGTVDFGAGNVTSAGGIDVFVVKLNSAGQAVVAPGGGGAWDTTAGSDTNYGSITFGGTGTDYGRGVAVDGSGNVHVAGYFRNTVDFGAGDVTSAGAEDAFVTKLNSAGAHQWTTTFGGTGTNPHGTSTDTGFGVAVDGAGNVHVAGYFTDTVDFGAGD